MTYTFLCTGPALPYLQLAYQLPSHNLSNTSSAINLSPTSSIHTVTYSGKNTSGGHQPSLQGPSHIQHPWDMKYCFSMLLPDDGDPTIHKCFFLNPLINSGKQYLVSLFTMYCMWHSKFLKL